MSASNLFKRSVVVLLAGLLIVSFVACKKKPSDVDTSSQTSEIVSSSQIRETKDDADDMTESELSELEKEVFGNGNVSIETPSKNDSSSAVVSDSGDDIPEDDPTSSNSSLISSTITLPDSSSSVPTLSNGPGISISGTSSSSTSSETASSDVAVSSSAPSVSSSDDVSVSSSTPVSSTPESSNTSSVRTDFGDEVWTGRY